MYISYALASDCDDVWIQYKDNIVKRSFQPPRGCTRVTADWRAAVLRPRPAPRCPGLTFRPTPGLWVGRLYPRTVGWIVTDSVTVPLLCGSSDKSKADSVSLLLSFTSPLHSLPPQASPIMPWPLIVMIFEYNIKTVGNSQLKSESLIRP